MPEDAPIPFDDLALQPGEMLQVQSALEVTGDFLPVGLLGYLKNQTLIVTNPTCGQTRRRRRASAHSSCCPTDVGHLFALKGMAEGPFPEHYEPFETPLPTNPMHPKNPKALSNPAARVFKGDRAELGKADKFPYIATTYRLTEHFHFWTMSVGLTAIVQPSQFVELDEELAKEKGIASGDVVKVTSNRGHVLATAVVTKRLKPLTVDGRKVHTVGIPIHWGFVGVAKQGFLANRLTPSVGDANTQTPEYKAVLVNVEKA